MVDKDKVMSVIQHERATNKIYLSFLGLEQWAVNFFRAGESSKKR